MSRIATEELPSPIVAHWATSPLPPVARPPRAGRTGLAIVGGLTLAVVGVLAVLGLAAGIGGRHFEDAFTIPGAPSQVALDELKMVFPDASGNSALVVLTVPEGQKATDADVKKAVEASADRLEKLDIVKSVRLPYNEHVKGLISDDGRSAMMTVQVTVQAATVTEAQREELQHEGALLQQALPGSEVHVGGEIFAVNMPKLSPVEFIGIGTGNPDHVTGQAIKALNAADLILIPRKGEAKSDLADLRRQILSQVLTAPVPVAGYDVPGRADQDDYLGAVNDWHDAIAQVWAATIAAHRSGAANVAITRICFKAGVDPAKCLVVDSQGILHDKRQDIFMRRAEYVDKWRLCQVTNAEGRTGNIPEALVGADVCIALSKPGPGTILPEWVSTMAEDAIVMACANPVPEIWPWEAQAAGAKIVATGRSDFPNQVNNSLGFPGIFRGALDVRAKTITDEMCLAAAYALADAAPDGGMDPDCILPTMVEWEVYAKEAVAVGMKAQEQGIARLNVAEDDLFKHAAEMILRSRRITEVMMQTGLIAEPPESFDSAALRSG